MPSTLPLLLLLSACSIQAVVHRIAVTHQRLPPSDEAHHELFDGGMEPWMTTTDVATKDPLNVTDYGYSLIGNISLGSPAQVFSVAFDFYSSNLYVLDKDAQYYSPFASSSSSATTNVTGKQTYDPSVTNSLLVVNANFSSSYTFLNGSVVSDVLQVGDGLEAAVLFEDTSLVRSYMKYNAYDGVFGLSSVPAKNTSTTLLDQLQYSLDSPVYTLSWDNCTGSANCTGQLTLGGLAPDTCQDDAWAALTGPVNTSSPSAAGMPAFNITSVSATAAGDSNGCSQQANTPVTVYVSATYSTMWTSYQVHELFVQASNASYNHSSRRYELTSDQMAQAQPVHLNLPSGGVLRLHPDDYTRVDSKGKHFLNVYGWYNAHEMSQSSITLGLSSLSHHCLSKDFHTGVWSITDRVPTA